MTANELSGTIAEIKAACEGSFVDKIVQTAPWEWVFAFRKGGRKSWLLVSLSPRNGRAHLVFSAHEALAENGHFTRLLKKTLERGYLFAVTQPGLDRILRLSFNTAGGDYHLACELMGTRANAFLLNSEEKVIAMALDRRGRIASGDIYTPPPPRPITQETDTKPSYMEDGGFPASRAMEAAHRESAEKEKTDELRREAAAPLLGELKKIGKLKVALEKEMEQLACFKDDRRLGDILQASFHLIRKGCASITVPDVYSAEERTVEIPLNPALGPAENVALYYKRHRKFEKGLARIAETLRELDKKTAAIKERLLQIESGKWRPEPKPEGIARQKALHGQAAKAKQKAAQTGPRRFISSEGHLIMVGRNDRENDELTFRIASGKDLWLHARDYPGSHVVAKLPKGIQLPQITLREAAMLAIHYSKAAKSGKGEVTWLFAKDVKKPKRAAPGKVIVTGAKSLAVRVDEELIKEMKRKGEEA